MPLKHGDLVDRYRILARLGAGGMGEVYRAHDTRLQRDIALKILHTDATSGTGSGSGPTSDGATRLLREARSVAALEHPNVITIHDVGEIAQPEELRGTPYIAMELIKGRSLRDLAVGPPAPLEERIRWLVGAAKGLGAAHKAGIIHRDVKPENVMVKEDGIVKVLDFGIAKRSYPSTSVDPTSSTEAQLLPQLSTKGVVIGTPYYMAPEQMRNDSLDGRADQFSWAVIAYELLAGKAPWRVGGDALQLVSEILSHTPPPPSSLNPEIPPHVDALVMRALSKSRQDRFPTMSHVVEALSAAGFPAVPSLPPPTSPFARTESIAAATNPGVISTEAPAAQPALPPATRTARSAGAGTSSWIRAGLVLAGAAALGVAGMLYRSHAASAPGATLAKTSDAGDDSGRASTVPEATSAYREAMTAMRDADMTRTIRELDAALRADPSFAAAHLRYALTGTRYTDGMRAHLQEALRRRAMLDEHDKVIAGALTPMSTAPGDMAETEKRLAEAAARSPDDADFALQLCRFRQALALPSAVETCKRASALDPGAALPYRALAWAEVQAGDVRGGLASFDACIRAFPLATYCMTSLFQLQAFEGDCDGALASAKRLVSADPEAPEPYDALSEALLGSDAPLESVHGALEAKFAHMSPADALVTRREDLARLALRIGDFAGARERLRAWDDAVATSGSEDDHFAVARLRVPFAIEEGRTSDAKTLAASYLAHRGAWSTPDGYDYSIQFDGFLYRTGGLTRDEFVRRRAKWLAWAKAKDPEPRGYVWIKAYAAPAVDAADAREALDALPDYLPLPNAMLRAPEYEFPIGETYRLAGRDAEALPYLTRSAKACLGREGPLEQTWASLSLGRSLEKLGESHEACEAYRVVANRWKSAATSLSARQAAAQLRALACSP